jgi:hypothetical protein
MISHRRLYVTADQKTVVEEGDPRAAFLLVAEGCELDDGLARRYDLVGPGQEPKGLAAPVAPAAKK